MSEWTLEAPTQTPSNTGAPAGGGNSGGSGTKWQPIPDKSILEAVCLGTETRTMPFNDDAGQPVLKFSFKFKVTDAQFTGREITGETSNKFVAHPDCRSYSWVTEILGQELQPNSGFDPSSLVGKPCRILVKAQEKQRRDGTGTWWLNTVSDVLRSMTATAAPAPVQAQPAFNEEPF